MSQESLSVISGAEALELLQAIKTVDGLYSLISISQDFMLEVAKRNIDGVSVVDKYGVNRNITIAQGLVEVWEQGGSYTYDADATAPIQYVSSSDAADVGQTVSVQGLDVDGTMVEQEMTTNGQSNVTLDTALWRVFRMENNSDFGGDINGILYCHTDPTPTNGVPTTGAIRAIIQNSNNQTMMNLYTVPKGKVGFVLRGEFGLAYEGNAAALAEYATPAYYSRRYGKCFKNKKELALVVGGSSVYQDLRPVPDIVPDLTDIRFSIRAVSADNMGVFSTMHMLLFDESMFSTELLTALGQSGYVA